MTDTPRTLADVVRESISDPTGVQPPEDYALTVWEDDPEGTWWVEPEARPAYVKAAAQVTADRIARDSITTQYVVQLLDGIGATYSDVIGQGASLAWDAPLPAAMLQVIVHARRLKAARAAVHHGRS